MTLTNVKIGADPELFLSMNGKVISAEGLIGGTKDSPKLISENGHAIQEDNVMAEFNIPPCTTAEEYKENINFVKNHLTVLAELYGLEISPLASAELDPLHLNTIQAKTFGCDPDFSVYTKCHNNPPENNGLLRSCGGHIHIGYDEPSVEKSELIVYAMDTLVGLESVLKDADDRRKEMYGKAGSFRFKEYGVEYRTLSNFWIHSDELIEWAFLRTMEAVELVNSGEIQNIIETKSESIREAIDTNNKVEAAKLLEDLKKVIIK